MIIDNAYTKRYEAKKATMREYNKKIRNKNRIKFIELLNGRVCSVCSFSNTDALDFHHVNPNEKFLTISNLLSNNYSEEIIMLEVEKCIILCSNCHFIHHFRETEYGGGHTNRSSIKKWYYQYKATLSCQNCSENRPYCLQFHHRDPSIKIESVSRLVASQAPTKLELMEEIAKCDVLCANCHRILHREIF